MVNFLKFKIIYFIISAVVIVAGLLSIGVWGYRFSIDFVGGTSVEYNLKKEIKPQALEKILNDKQIEAIDYQINKNNLTLRSKPLTEKMEREFKEELKSKSGGEVTVLRSETVGPTLGRETMVKTGVASLLAIVGILIYMSFSFKGFKYALAAIIAMFHDFLVVVGSYSIISHFFRAEVDTMFVTAVLTTMSFSVHDTIVIFDKIREYVNTEGKQDIEHYANRALTETMVRSINNSMTIVFMLLALALMGGATIRYFVIALLIGTITGTYSSPFVATPILVWLEKRKKKN